MVPLQRIRACWCECALISSQHAIHNLFYLNISRNKTARSHACARTEEDHKNARSILAFCSGCRQTQIRHRHKQCKPIEGVTEQTHRQVVDSEMSIVVVQIRVCRGCNQMRAHLGRPPKSHIAEFGVMLNHLLHQRRAVPQRTRHMRWNFDPWRLAAIC